MPINHQYNNPPISDQSTHPMPTLDQSRMTVLRRQPLHSTLECHHFNTCQSNANPMSMQVDNCTLIFLEQVYRGKLLVSTEDDFTPIPITDLLQSRTISATYPRPSCQSTNTCPSNANPQPIHLALASIEIHQFWSYANISHRTPNWQRSWQSWTNPS